MPDVADHARKQVRDAAVADLTGLATTGANVFTSRVAKLTTAQMPGLKVMLWDEAGELGGQALGTMLRRGRLVVECWVQGGDDIEDDLDAIAAEVESRIYGDTPALDALLFNIAAVTTAIDFPEPDDGVAKWLGRLRMLFPIEYRTRIADPTVVVDQVPSLDFRFAANSQYLPLI